MTTNTIKLLAAIFAVIMALSMAGPVAGMAMTEGQTTADVSLAEGTLSDVSGDGVHDRTAGDATIDTEPAVVTPEVREMSGESEVMLRLPPADNTGLEGDRDAVQANLERHAETTQEPALDRLEAMSGAAVEETFWIANAVLVTVDFDRVDLDELRTLPGVELIHEHHTFDAPEPVEVESDAEPTDDDVTYGLDQINAPDVWDEFDVTGDSVRVVVSDTGVDADHDDIILADEDPWNDLYGDEDEPIDEHGHGTHVGGTIAGQDTSGTAIGVAPDVEHAHARVCGGGSCDGDAIMNSFQWAVDTDSDIISLSLGGPVDGSYVEVIYNTMDAGTLVVSSIGNDGEGTAGSPGAPWDSIASGASDENEDIADFSGGDLMEEGDFGGEWMDHWDDDPPEGEFITPDIAAPGVEVWSAEPGGDYQHMSGTSMSAPHKSGAAALIMAANPDIGPWEIQDLMMDTAWKPDDWDPNDAEHYNEETERDTRYGTGIIDVHAAVGQVATDSGIEGTVTDAEDGSAIEGATVSVADGPSTETNATGEYGLTLTPDTYDVTAEAFGYEADTEPDVEIEDDEHVETVNFALERTVEAELLEAQPEKVEGGEELTAVLEVVHADDVSVSLAGDYDESELSLTIAGQSADFDEAVAVDDGEIDIVVSTPEDTEGTIELSAHTSGYGDTETTALGETEVLETLVRLGVVDDVGAQGDALVEVLEDELADFYDIETTEADDLDHEVYVVQSLDGENAEEFVSETEDPETGVVYLDQWGDDATGVTQFAEVSDEVDETESGFEEDADGPHYFVEQEHEILEGFEADDEILIHTDDWSDHVWMTGTDFEVLAGAGLDSSEGPGIAIDEDTSTVLAASSGLTDFVTPADLTSDASLLLGNSVEHVAPEEEDDDDPEEGYVQVGEAWGETGDTVTIEFETDAVNVAGYQAELTFNDSVVEFVNASGVDLPVDEVNDEESDWIAFTGAQETGVDEPHIAELTFEVVGDAGEETDISFVEDETALNDDDEDWIEIEEFLDGTIGVGEACQSEGGPGDVNDDGNIGSLDATLTMQHLAEHDLETFDEDCADLTGDGDVTPSDVTYIQQIIVGLEDPPEE